MDSLVESPYKAIKAIIDFLILKPDWIKYFPGCDGRALFSNWHWLEDYLTEEEYLAGIDLESAYLKSVAETVLVFRSDEIRQKYTRGDYDGFGSMTIGNPELGGQPQN